LPGAAALSKSEVARPAQRKGEISGAKLLEIAADLFRRQGYVSTTMRDIADAAGMKAGSLYYHFSAKDEILGQVLARSIEAAIDGFRKAMAAVSADADFRLRFTAAVTAHIRTVHEFGNYTHASRNLLTHVPASAREKHRAMRAEYDGLWRDLMRQGEEAGEIASPLPAGVVRQFLLGALNWTTEWADPGRKNFDELGAIASQLFLNALARPIPQPGPKDPT
jgi:AcrR family transcriptional regulator